MLDIPAADRVHTLGVILYETPHRPVPRMGPSPEPWDRNYLEESAERRNPSAPGGKSSKTVDRETRSPAA